MVSACTSPASELTVEIESGTEVVTITVGNNGDQVREVDDQFLRDYSGSRSPLQLIVGLDGETVEQCRSMDYLGPPKIVEIPPGAEFKFQTGISALVHTFCLYEPGTYSLQARYVEPQGESGVSNTAEFVLTQQRIDHHIRPRKSSR